MVDADSPVENGWVELWNPDPNPLGCTLPCCCTLPWRDPNGLDIPNGVAPPSVPEVLGVDPYSCDVPNPPVDPNFVNGCWFWSDDPIPVGCPPNEPPNGDGVAPKLLFIPPEGGANAFCPPINPG